MAGVDFDSVLRISAFLIALYLIGRSCKVLGVSPIIGEMIVGVLLGPNVAGFVPNAEFFELAGIFGVTLMIFESGMHLDFEMLKAVGLKATVVAILGTFLPIGAGLGAIYALGGGEGGQFPIWPTGLAVGITLAPTSVGMALKMLGEAHQLGETYGQLIVTAAFIDDILSLVGLTMLLEIGKATQTGSELSIVAVTMPLVSSIAFCVLGALLAYPMKGRTTFVRKYFLCWVGLFPRVVPHVVELLARLIEFKIDTSRHVRRQLLGETHSITAANAANAIAATAANAIANQSDRRASFAEQGSANGISTAGWRTPSPLPTRAAPTPSPIRPEHSNRVRTLSYLYAPTHHKTSTSVLARHKQRVASLPKTEPAAAAPELDEDCSNSRRGKEGSSLGDAVDRINEAVHELAAHVHLGEKGALHEAHDHHEVIFDLRERVLLMLMFALLLLYGWVSNMIGSHLLGAFTAGVSFCWMEHHAALVLWHSQVKRIAGWLIRLFFGATVAFAIPINQMMNLMAFAKGMALGVGPCVATKVSAGLVTGSEKWVVGFAMVGRGEFAYLVAQTAQSFALNPAPAAFAEDMAAHAALLTLTPSGSYCYDCGDASSTVAASGSSGRRLAASDDASGLATWCKRCMGVGANYTCDALPVPGGEYWQPGKACTEHPDACPCEMMMSADAFSITVWALVLASVLAPLGFGLVLNQHVRRRGGGKQEETHGAVTI